MTMLGHVTHVDVDDHPGRPRTPYIRDIDHGITHVDVDKGRFGSYTKLCDFYLLFMILQVELKT